MKKPLKMILILLAIAAIAYAALYFNKSSETDESQLTLFGNIDIRQVELNFHDPEHIAEMYVKEGDRVKKGQLLATQDLERFQYTVIKWGQTDKMGTDHDYFAFLASHTFTMISRKWKPETKLRWQ